MSNDNIFKTDNTGAFGNNFITINLVNPEGYVISKAVFVCGCIQKTFNNPDFPLHINFTSEETAGLRNTNTCYLVVYDSEGRQKTCQGTLTFEANNGVIKGINGRTCC